MSGNGGRAGKAYTALRRLVLHRDGHTCTLCGITCTTTGNPNADTYATLDHITPLSHARDRTHRRALLLDPHNCRIACRRCNTNRGNTAHLPATNPLPGW